MRHPQEGRFIISLDFELIWGVRDKRTLESYGKNLVGVREVIPSLLDLFTKYGIHATFATVGFLFARSKEELLNYIPAPQPVYSRNAYSPYTNNYLESIGLSEQDDPYHYAGSLVRMIQQCPGQEIASHTFSHYYCLEQASLESFETDLVAAKNIAANYNVDLKSIVFPRNQYSRQHIEICRKLGFIAYRGNETSSIYTPRKNEDQNLLLRTVRLADSYINFTGHHTFQASWEDNICNVPASRFFRPYSARFNFMDPLRIQRIKNSMSYAAKHRQAFHLWWHPHNFGMHLFQNLSLLEEVLLHYRSLNEKFGMQSKSMQEIAKETLFENAI